MKSKAEAMRRLRRRRKLAGLEEFRRWVTPQNKKALEEFAKHLEDK